MAHKTIPGVNELDKKYIEDNMLTDEDIQFAIFSSGLDSIFDENNLLEYITSIPEASDSEALSQNIKTLESSITNAWTDEGLYPLDVKMEPLSPRSFSTNNSIVENISKNPLSSLDCHTNSIINNTPPHTPPHPDDGRTNSPVLIDSTNVISVPELCPTSFTNALINIQNMDVSFAAHQPRLKSQIKIQPKPAINGDSNNGMCKPLVFTSEQLSMLSSGALKIKPVQNNLLNASESIQSLHSTNTAIKTTDSSAKISNNIPYGISKQIQGVDLAAMKRQQRMIKNRESACLSRKKKKEHLQKLEQEVKEMSSFNAKLQIENTCLKQRIFNLENENENLKSNIRKLNDALSSKISPKALKKTVGLMVVVFMLTVNLAPLTRLFEKDGLSKNIPSSNSHHISRTLLWEDEVKIENDSAEFPNFIKNNSINIVEEWDAYNVTVCPTFINKTESQRLDNDLRGLVKRVSKKQKLKDIAEFNFDSHKTLPPLPKLKSWIRRKHEWDENKAVKAESGIMIYHTPRKSYEEFFDAIHRRDDTFYFVSFSGDHLLLPPTVQNQTFRPRMSIVMPAMTFNDTMGSVNDHICMMQIDCEVMNTKLLYVKESAIPSHFRQKHNSTKTNQTKKPQQKNLHLQSSKLKNKSVQ